MDNYLTVKFETAKSIFYTTFAKIKTEMCQDSSLICDSLSNHFNVEFFIFPKKEKPKQIIRLLVKFRLNKTE